jgi:hypothetical protein
MALPILDGNQSATTLSSILTSGEHIPAHTVVSLGTQAITDISGAVSGSVVSISNFPATQTIAGTVTANLPDGALNVAGIAIDEGGAQPNYGVQLGYFDAVTDSYLLVNPTNPLPISGTVTIGAGTAQIGSVTANIGLNLVGPSVRADSGFSLSTRGMMVVGGISTSDVGSDNEYRELKITSTGEALVRGTVTVGNSVTIGSLPTISGTVTANGGDFSAIVGESMPAKAVAIGFYSGDDAGIAQVNDSNRKMPISGTVTVGNSVTIASFATSVTARLINPAGTAVTYAEVGTAGSPSIDVLSVQGVTSGTPLTILNHQGTAVTTSDFTSTTDSTVLANYNASREVLTIFNEGAGNLHICAGATCTTIAYQVRLSAGDYYEVPNHQTTITHSAVFATAGTARVTEVS